MATFNIRVFHTEGGFSAYLYDGGRMVIPLDVSDPSAQSGLDALFRPAFRGLAAISASGGPVKARKRRVVKEPEASAP